MAKGRIGKTRIAQRRIVRTFLRISAKKKRQRVLADPTTGKAQQKRRVQRGQGDTKGKASEGDSCTRYSTRIPVDYFQPAR